MLALFQQSEIANPGKDQQLLRSQFAEMLNRHQVSLASGLNSQLVNASPPFPPFTEAKMAHQQINPATDEVTQQMCWAMVEMEVHQQVAEVLANVVKAVCDFSSQETQTQDGSKGWSAPQSLIHPTAIAAETGTAVDPAPVSQFNILHIPTKKRKSLGDLQASAERTKERNREHAKKTRLRKKLLLSGWQTEMALLKQQAESLKIFIIRSFSADESQHILERCCPTGHEDQVKIQQQMASVLSTVCDPLVNRGKQNLSSDLDPHERTKERNRFHAKKTRLRKKFFLSGLQTEIAMLKEYTAALNAVIVERVGEQEAAKVIQGCYTAAGCGQQTILVPTPQHTVLTPTPQQIMLLSSPVSPVEQR
jgi:hypothetical protein